MWCDWCRCHGASELEWVGSVHMSIPVPVGCSSENFVQVLNLRRNFYQVGHFVAPFVVSHFVMSVRACATVSLKCR